MTYANITINGEDFCVTHDGGDKKGIRNTIQAYIDEIKKKVKPGYIAKAVINQIIADGQDYYSWIQSGVAEFAERHYEAKIDSRGRLTFREIKNKQKLYGVTKINELLDKHNVKYELVIQ